MYSAILPGQVAAEVSIVLSDEEEEFVRYTERRSDMGSCIDDLMSQAQQVQDALFEGKEPLNEFSELENSLQRLTELQTYIEQGTDIEETNEEDLWPSRPTDDNEGRWREFDEFHQIQRKHQDEYAEVTITDEGDDLLTGETYFVHDVKTSSQSESYQHLGKCPNCGELIDEEGYCTGCYKLYPDRHIGP
jgi:hypothetical protein